MIQRTPQTVMPVCKQLHPVAHANRGSVVFLQPHLLLENRRQRWRKCEFPSQRSTVWPMCSVWTQQGDADDHRDRIQPHTIRSLPQGMQNGVHKVLHTAHHYHQQHTLWAWLIEMEKEMREPVHTQRTKLVNINILSCRGPRVTIEDTQPVILYQHLLSKVNQWSSCELKLLR